MLARSQADAGTPVWDQAGSAAFHPRSSSGEASAPERQDEVLETAHTGSGVFDGRSQMSPAVIAVSDNQNSQLRPNPAGAPLPNSVAGKTHRRGARCAARSDAVSRQAIEQLIIEQTESVPAGTQMPAGAGGSSGLGLVLGWVHRDRAHGRTALRVRAGKV